MQHNHRAHRESPVRADAHSPRRAPVSALWRLALLAIITPMTEPASILASLDRMVETLSSHKQVRVIAWLKNPPASDATIATAERALGATLDPFIERFYRAVNGACLVWNDKKSEEHRHCTLKKLTKLPTMLDGSFTGGFLLPPLELVFGDHPVGYTLDTSEDLVTCYGRTESYAAFSRRIRPFDLPGTFYSAAFLVEHGAGNPKVIHGNDHAACYTDSYVTSFERYIEQLLGSFATIEDRFAHYNARSIRRGIEAPPAGDGAAALEPGGAQLGDYLIAPRNPKLEASRELVREAWSMTAPQRAAALPALAEIFPGELWSVLAYLRGGVDDPTSDAIAKTLWSMLPPLEHWQHMTKATRTVSAFWPGEVLEALAGVARHDPRDTLPVIEAWADWVSTGGTANVSALAMGSILGRSGPEGRPLAERLRESAHPLLAQAGFVASTCDPTEHREALLGLVAGADAMALGPGTNEEAAVNAVRAAVCLSEADPTVLAACAPLLRAAARARLVTPDSLHRRAFELVWTHDPESLTALVEEAFERGLLGGDFEMTQRALAARHFDALVAATDAPVEQKYSGIQALLQHASDPALRKRIVGYIKAGLKDGSLATYAIPLKRWLRLA